MPLRWLAGRPDSVSGRGHGVADRQQLDRQCTGWPGGRIITPIRKDAGEKLGDLVCDRVQLLWR